MLKHFNPNMKKTACIALLGAIGLYSCQNEVNTTYLIAGTWHLSDNKNNGVVNKNCYMATIAFKSNNVLAVTCKGTTSYGRWLLDSIDPTDDEPIREKDIIISFPREQDQLNMSGKYLIREQEPAKFVLEKKIGSPDAKPSVITLEKNWAETNRADRIGQNNTLQDLTGRSF